MTIETLWLRGFETMPEVASADWWTWAFWARDPSSIRDLVITIGALLGIPFVVWREWLHHNQTRAALQDAESAQQQAVTAERRHDAQVEADRERRITDNFTRAVELLGSDKLESRLGAIYTLERIARESLADHWPIMETLTAYVRERVPWNEQRSSDERAESPAKPVADIQAAMTVIGRACRKHDPEGQRLDLRRTDLRGANLASAHLEAADLFGAHLDRAIMEGAHLQGAILAVSHLNKACLRGAHLEQAELRRAYLQETNLAGADLYMATLARAHLEDALFCDAKRAARLEGTWFSGAHLEGADLSDTDLTQEQFDVASSNERTKLPPHIKRRAQAGEERPEDSQRPQ